MLQTAYLFTCLLVSHVWTLSPSTSEKSLFTLHIKLFTAAITSLTLLSLFRKHSKVRVRLQPRSSVWTPALGLVWSAGGILDRNGADSNLRADFAPPPPLSGKSTRVDNMPLKRILLMDPKIKPPRTEWAVWTCVTLSFTVAPWWCETLFITRSDWSDWAAFCFLSCGFLWTRHYWGSTQLAPLTNKLREALSHTLKCIYMYIFYTCTKWTVSF